MKRIVTLTAIFVVALCCLRRPPLPPARPYSGAIMWP